MKTIYLCEEDFEYAWHKPVDIFNIPYVPLDELNLYLDSLTHSTVDNTHDVVRQSIIDDIKREIQIKNHSNFITETK